MVLLMLWTILGNFFLLIALIYNSEKGSDYYHELDSSNDFNLIKTKPASKQLNYGTAE